MKIFFNGDSHTEGAEIPVNTSYAYQLAKLYDATIVDNPALSGCSNYRIIRTTDNFLEKCKNDTNLVPDLIVIGWSEPYRCEWFQDGDYFTVNPLTNFKSIEDKQRYLEESKVVNTSIFSSVVVHQHHKLIYNYHKKLEFLKIPHLFFNANTSFYEHLRRIKDENYPIPTTLYEYDWDKTFWNPYSINDDSFMNWAHRRNYPTVTTQFRHYVVEAHIEFAQVLKKHIDEFII